MKKNHIAFLVIIYIITLISPSKLVAYTVELTSRNAAGRDNFHLIDSNHLVAVHTWHLFSNALQPDSFALRLSGKNISKGMIHFTIYNSHHKLIYQENFPANGLLWCNYDELTPKQAEDTIHAS